MIRKINEKDIKAVDEIFSQCVLRLKNSGIDQWQTGYPNGEDAKEDMQYNEGYVFEENGIVKGYFCLSLAGEPTYEVIKYGAWKTNKPYAVIHRVAVAENAKGQGIGQKIYDYAINFAKEKNVNIRIDTHKDNLVMQKLIQKNGFEYCGIATMVDGSLRNAYELLL